MVVRNFQSPGEHFSVGFETPVFHWFSKQDRKRQICRYAVEHCGATKRQAEAAYRQAETAILSFRHQLVEEGKRVIADTGKAGGFAWCWRDGPITRTPSSTTTCPGCSPAGASRC